MRILVTGGSGFVGSHLIEKLLKSDHKVICIYRNEKKIKTFDWKDKVELIKCDIYEEVPDIDNNLIPDALIHLAWSGLPNYQSDHHVKINLPKDKAFLSKMLKIGIKHILITGTCFEFGMQYGPLSPSMPTYPDNPYAIAKDRLRDWFLSIPNKKNLVLQWVRLFYMYGLGQNSNSIISQLDKAIDNNEKVFNMSGGEQLRDYLEIKEIANRLGKIVEDPSKKGIIHCCKGEPISIRRLVENHINKRNANIKPNLGYYSYPKHEALAFWGAEND